MHFFYCLDSDLDLKIIGAGNCQEMVGSLRSGWFRKVVWFQLTEFYRLGRDIPGSHFH